MDQYLVEAASVGNEENLLRLPICAQNDLFSPGGSKGLCGEMLCQWEPPRVCWRIKGLKKKKKKVGRGTKTLGWGCSNKGHEKDMAWAKSMEIDRNQTWGPPGTATKQIECVESPLPMTHRPPVNEHRPWQILIGVGRLVSTKHYLFLGSVLTYQRVYFLTVHVLTIDI